MVFLPCCLAIPLLVRVRKVNLWPLIGVFALNPAVMQNATYTWTKMLTAFFVVLAVCLYLSGWRKRDSLRMTAAFVALAAGLLVHYSAGPYCVFFALHYLLVLFRGRPDKWKELAAITLASGFLLCTWFAWSIASYGARPTFTSNTSLTPTMHVEGSNLAKITGNFLDSVVPRISYDSKQAHLFDQPYAPATVRDNVFLLYNTNLILSMGLIGGPLVVCFVIAAFRRQGPGGERNFWMLLIAFTLLTGFAVVGERDYFGVAHLTLVPLELLGLTVLAAKFLSRRLVAYLIVAGCAIDFSAGIFFHARIQHLDNTAAHTYFTGLSYGNGAFVVGGAGPESLGIAAWRNWLGKHHIANCERWLVLGDSYRPGDPAVEAARVDLRAAITEQMKEDDIRWHGWYRRHGGEFELIGDHFGGDATSVILALAAIALLWKMAQQAPAATVAVAAKPRSSRSRRKR